MSNGRTDNLNFELAIENFGPSSPFTYNRKKQPAFFIPPEREYGEDIVSIPVNSYGTPTLSNLGATDMDYYYMSAVRNVTNDAFVASAIREIVNEMVPTEPGKARVTLKQTATKESEMIPSSIMNKLEEELEYILDEVMQFNRRGEAMARHFFIDGKIYFYKRLIDADDPRKGLLGGGFGVQRLDSMKMKKVLLSESDKFLKSANINTYQRINTLSSAIRDDTFFNSTRILNGSFSQSPSYYKEMFFYNNAGFWQQANAGTVTNVMGSGAANPGQLVPFLRQQVSYATCGYNEASTGLNIPVSPLWKAIKLINILKGVEDASVMNKIARGMEKRIIYVDVGQMSAEARDREIEKIKTSFNTQVKYNPRDGSVTYGRAWQNVMEDLFIPRHGEQKMTEVTSIGATSNFSDIEDIKYFYKKMLLTLGVPLARLDPELKASTVFSIGKSSEITREEVSFSYFIEKLQRNFSDIFLDLLGTQMIITGKMEQEEWDVVKSSLAFDFNNNNFWRQQKEREKMQEEATVLATIEPMMGMFYSKTELLRNVRNLSEEQIQMMKDEIQKEKKNGDYKNPVQEIQAEMGAEMGGPGMDAGGGPPGAPPAPAGPPGGGAPGGGGAPPFGG